MIGDAPGDFVSSFRIMFNFVELYTSYSGLINSFVPAYCCCFSQLWRIIKTEVKLGVSHNGQQSTCRKTIRISLTCCARSVLVALWNIDDKATMVHVHETFLTTPEASLMIPHVGVLTIFYH